MNHFEQLEQRFRTLDVWPRLLQFGHSIVTVVDPTERVRTPPSVRESTTLREDGSTSAMGERLGLDILGLPPFTGLLIFVRRTVNAVKAKVRTYSLPQHVALVRTISCLLLGFVTFALDSLPEIVVRSESHGWIVCHAFTE